MCRAFSAIMLPSLWRNTLSNITIGILPQRSSSLSTAPGPTEGSWSASPTNTSRHMGGSAWNRYHVIAISSILISSTSTRSASTCSGMVRVFVSPAVRFSALWTVQAGRPLLCSSRRAARPVGAQQIMSASGNAFR